MTLRRVQPGGTWKPPTSADVNTTAKCVDEWVQTSELSKPARAIPITRPSDRIKVKNLTGAARSLGEVVEVGDSLLDNTTRLHLTFEGHLAANGERYAILLDECRDDGIVPAQVGGLVQARVDISDLLHTCATPQSQIPYLLSSDFGPFRLWWHPPGETGIQDCIVMLDSPAGNMMFQAPSGGIPPMVGSVVGSAECALFTVDSLDTRTAMVNASESPITKPVKSIFSTAIAAGRYGIAAIEYSGNLMVISYDCA